MNEEWKPVVGFEGLYEVSSMGMVRSLDRTVNRGGSQMRLRGRQLKLASTTHGGYPQVSLWKNRRRRQGVVHTIVLEAFVGKRPEGLVCRHLDGNPRNNRVSNLTWGTQKENEADKKRHGTYYARGIHIGENNSRSKLTSDQVRKIRRLYRKGGITQTELAKRFGVGQPHISTVVRRAVWGHIGWEGHDE